MHLFSSNEHGVMRKRGGVFKSRCQYVTRFFLSSSKTKGGQEINQGTTTKPNEKTACKVHKHACSRRKSARFRNAFENTNRQNPTVGHPGGNWRSRRCTCHPVPAQVATGPNRDTAVYSRAYPMAAGTPLWSGESRGGFFLGLVACDATCQKVLQDQEGRWLFWGQGRHKRRGDRFGFRSRGQREDRLLWLSRAADII